MVIFHFFNNNVLALLIVDPGQRSLGVTHLHFFPMLQLFVPLVHDYVATLCHLLNNEAMISNTAVQIKQFLFQSMYVSLSLHQRFSVLSSCINSHEKHIRGILRVHSIHCMSFPPPEISAKVQPYYTNLKTSLQFLSEQKAKQCLTFIGIMVPGHFRDQTIQYHTNKTNLFIFYFVFSILALKHKAPKKQNYFSFFYFCFETY